MSTSSGCICNRKLRRGPAFMGRYGMVPNIYIYRGAPYLLDCTRMMASARHCCMPRSFKLFVWVPWSTLHTVNWTTEAAMLQLQAGPTLQVDHVNPGLTPTQDAVSDFHTGTNRKKQL